MFSGETLTVVEGCSGIKEVVSGETLTVVEGCSGIKEVVSGETLTVVEGCSGIKEVVSGETLTVVEGCSGIKEVVSGETVILGIRFGSILILRLRFNTNVDWTMLRLGSDITILTLSSKVVEVAFGTTIVVSSGSIPVLMLCPDINVVVFD